MKPRTKSKVKPSYGRFSVLLPMEIRQPLIDMAEEEERTLSGQITYMLRRDLEMTRRARNRRAMEGGKQ